MIITGTNGNDFGLGALLGGASSDTIFGLNGVDQLFGQGGDDILFGGLGDDWIFGGAGTDTVSYAYSHEGVFVNLASSSGVYTAHDDQDLLSEVENATGSAFGDYLVGTGGANALSGGKGSDQLEGGKGADRIEGGEGIDHAYYNSSAVGVTVNLATGVGAGGDAQGDHLTGIENLHGSDQGDSLTGDGGENALFGRAGNDTLKGGSGGDWLSGDAGVDTLWGGGAADRFVFNPGDSAASKGAADTIADFREQQGDIIDLSGFGNDGFPYPSSWGFTFVGDKAFTAEHQVRAISEGGDTLVGLNIAGNSGAEVWLRLDGVHSLEANDFYL